jgi:hypothetical protein
MVTLSMNIKGFTFETWYNMPVQLRNHYVEIIKQKVEEKNKKAQLQAQQQTHRFSKLGTK